MKVLVDTGVWSLAFRRKNISTSEKLIVEQLQMLILDGAACMTGAIRQEVLSGIKHPQQYEKLKVMLRAFDDLTTTQSDYELAADMFNICRRQGVQGSHIDFLICATAANADFPIFTIDGDFPQYAALVPIKLYAPPDSLAGIHDDAAGYESKE